MLTGSGYPTRRRIVPGVGAVATIEVGQGPPVLLVHGLNGFKEGWGPLPGALADAGMRAVMVDLPGSGASPRLRRTTPAALADALVPLLDALRPAGIVAHSLGTQVAMIAAAARPARIGRLALISPWVLPRPRRLRPRSVTDVLRLPLVGRPLARLAIAHMRRSPARRRAAFLDVIADPAALAGDPVMAELLDDATARLARADVRAMTDWAASALAIDLRPLAPSVAAPALVVSGTRDRVTRPAGADALAAALPHGRLLRLEGVGHFPHLEAPGRVLPAVAEHLA